MKKSIVISGVMLLIGSLLEVSVLLFNPDNIFEILLVYSGFGFLLSGVLLLTVTFLTVMVPSVNEKLNDCQH
jgi:hypothetical protein